MLKLFKILLFITASISLPASAAIINTYYETPGDNRAVFDDATNLIWLDLSETAGLTQAEALSKFSGFKVATSAQAFELIGDLSNTSVTPNFQYSYVSANSWIELFGSSEANLELGTKGAGTACLTWFTCSYGATEQGNYYGFGYGTDPSGNNLFNRLPGDIVAELVTPDVEGTKISQVAWFLVADLTTFRATQSGSSPSVPEPTTVALLAAALLLLTSRRIKS